MRINLIRGKFIPCAVFLIALLAACIKPDYKAGDVYSVDTGEEMFRVVKVLAVDSGLIHIKIYPAQFRTRPAQVNTKELGTSKPGTQNTGAAYIPFEKDLFKEWEPELIKNEPVTEEELEPYRVWKESTGNDNK